MISISLYKLAKQFELGVVLFYRPTAKLMYQAECPNFENPAPGTMIDCSFTDIQGCDVSFADEFIINIQKYIKAFENVVFRLSDCNEVVRENLQAALAARNGKDDTKINIMYYHLGHYYFLDKMENNLQQTFDYLQDVGSITARDIAIKFEIEINSASNRLKKLYDSNKLFRTETKDENGRQHVYSLNE